MKKITTFLTKKKIWVLFFFLVALIASAFSISHVKINYDISKYLNAETETAKALTITEDEFGLTGNLQVMVSDIDEKGAKQLKDEMEEVDHVLTVNFDVSDPKDYHDNKALYVLLIDGDDYSENAKAVSSDIKDLLVDYHVNYGGSAIDKERLKESIEKEMVSIAVVATSLATAILLLTSESWFEPLILLAVAGVAILINLGTNVMFSSISYITKSISSVLQLALSIDYSIVLLNTYRKRKKESSSNQEAMSEAILQVLKPVSASGLTTLAGLCALLFMSYRIGFDIGIVLMKGIVISLLTSVTLLPAVILVLDRLLEKTKKKSIHFKGKFFASVAEKGSKVIVPLSLILIAVCGTFNYRNTYVYSNQSNVDKEIGENFSERNQFMIVMKKEEADYEKQEAFVTSIQEFTTSDGEHPLVSYTGMTDTVLEAYDTGKIVKQLEVSEEEADMLLSLALLSKDPSLLTLSFDEMVQKTDKLMKEDEDVISMASDETKDTIEKIVALKKVLESENTAEEFVKSFNEEPLSSLGATIDVDSLTQIYGLYFYDSISDSDVRFSTMLDYFVYCLTYVPSFSSKVDEATLQSLTYLDKQVNASITQAETPLSVNEFRQYYYKETGNLLSEEQAQALYASYYQSKGEEIKETIPYLSLMQYLVQCQLITDEEKVTEIKNSVVQYQTVTFPVSYQEFLPVLKNLIESQTGEETSLPMTEEMMKIVYVSYFEEAHAFDNYRLKGSKLVSYVRSLYQTSDLMKEQIGEELYVKLSDMARIDQALCDDTVYDYLSQYEKLTQLQKDIQSMTTTSEIDSDMILGVYVKIAGEKKLTQGKTIIAEDLLTYLDENKESNSLLKRKLTEEKLQKLEKEKGNLSVAKKMFEGENYTRLLLTMDLPGEGEETEAFLTYLKEKTREYFGNESYVAGESVSVYDLKDSFKTDEIIISLVTIFSLLVIIAFTFKSASLPVLLVTIIQGACFIAFSTNALTGPVFFMSYIISSCILMGATVDYGILMSTNYLENRKTMEKKEALEKAIQSSLPTIFTSGLILTVCGAAIYFLSSQASISSVGLLVFKGTISALLLILFVLPSFLYLFDKFIQKTTYHKKPEKILTKGLDVEEKK